MYEQSDWFASVALNVFGNSTTETVHAVRMFLGMLDLIMELTFY